MFTDELTGNELGCDPFIEERDYRVMRFGQVAAELEGRRVALYGSGKIARRVLARYADRLDIAALIDDASSEEQVDGLPVVGLEEAFARGIEMIAIAALPTSEFIVARRIADACSQHGVELIDLYGNDVIELISHDVVTTPDELEQVLDGCGVLCIDAAWDGKSALERWALKQAGIPNTFETLRACVAQLRERGVPIVSFVAKPDIELEELGPYDDVLRGYELGCTKENGIFRILRSRWPGARIIHVGMQGERDALVPRLVGVEGFDVAVEAGEQAPDAPAASDSMVASPAEKRLQAVLDKSSADPVGTGSATYSFGYRALGPVLLGYTIWFARQVREAGLDGVLFCARDGWLMRRVYEALRSACPQLCLPQSHYLRISRKAVLRALLDDDAFRRLVPSAVKGLEPSRMLSEFVGLDPDSFTIESGWDEDSERCRIRALEQNGEAVAAAAVAAREALLEHFRTSGLAKGATYAFCDFVALGTCQYLLQQVAPFSLRGFYVGRRGVAPSSTGNPAAYLVTEGDLLTTRYLEVEQAMCSPEPCSVGFDDKGAPLFAPERRSDNEIATMLMTHEGVMAFVRDYFGDGGLDECEIGPGFASAIFDRECRDIPKFARIDDLTGLPMDAEARSVSHRTTEAALLRLLAEFDRVCEENGLVYVATHGTLLGAVRDGGFVAGDRDLDVAMPRADYNRLVELAKGGAFKQPYALQTSEDDPEWFVGGYMRLRDVSAPAADGRGLWMDIMPLDNCPAVDAAVERRQRSVRTWQRMLYIKTYGFDLTRLWDVDPRKMSLYFLLAGRYSRSTLLRRLETACSTARPTGILTIFAGNYRCKRNTVRFLQEDIAGRTRMPFASTTVPAPGHAEQWLESYYGPDWRSASGSLD